MQISQLQIYNLKILINQLNNLTTPSSINAPFWVKWLRVSKAQASGSAIIGIRQIYILPTRWGMLFGVLLIALLVGSINYSLSLGYVLTFLLVSLGHLAMLHTWRNVVSCQVEILHTEPVFVGELANIVVNITDTKQRPRYAMTAYLDAAYPDAQDLPSSSNTDKTKYPLFNLALPTAKRGWQTVPRITLYSEFPLSLFHAWAYVQLEFRYLVYPTPSTLTLLKPKAPEAGGELGASSQTQGDEEFTGHKPYQVGDSPKRVDWKASSRGLGMLTKQYHGVGASPVWLDWALLSQAEINSELHLDYEGKISLLTRWVIDAHQAQSLFGLRLPNKVIAPSTGDVHYHACLTALALMD